MLEALAIKNFKAFLNLSIPLRPLTLLSGLNGMGKSTVIQSLLLLRQSYLGQVTGKPGNAPHLILNGDLVQLGTGFDVFSRSGESNDLSFSVNASEGRFIEWSYKYSSASNALEPSENLNSDLDLGAISLFGDEFHYLQAERLGPRVSYQVDDYQVRERNNLGTHGEFVPHFLHYREYIREPSTVVEETMQHPDAVSNKLTAQIEAWMGEISPGTRFDLDPIKGTDLIRLQVGFADGEFYRATNVGFGITYTLPILVALLASRPGGLVVLENPEAHLHPRGQSHIGELIARAADAGIQVLMETHSDHILNGVRIAVRNGYVEPEAIALHYFQRSGTDIKQTTSEVVTPELDRDGKLSFRPEGFFDEFDRSLDELL